MTEVELAKIESGHYQDAWKHIRPLTGEVRRLQKELRQAQLLNSALADQIAARPRTPVEGAQW